MMTSLNKVLLIGNLTRDPELRYLPSGTAVADLGLATNRRFKSSDGDLSEETTFVDITLFGKQAESITPYLEKGRPLFVEGRLKLDQWKTSEGDSRRKMKVIAERVQFVDHKKIA